MFYLEIFHSSSLSKVTGPLLIAFLSAFIYFRVSIPRTKKKKKMGPKIISFPFSIEIIFLDDKYPTWLFFFFFFFTKIQLSLTSQAVILLMIDIPKQCHFFFFLNQRKQGN